MSINYMYDDTFSLILIPLFHLLNFFAPVLFALLHCTHRLSTQAMRTLHRINRNNRIFTYANRFSNIKPFNFFFLVVSILVCCERSINRYNMVHRCMVPIVHKYIRQLFLESFSQRIRSSNGFHVNFDS